MRRMTVGLLAVAALAGQARAHGRVYTQSNAASGNEVLVLARIAGGALKAVSRVATGGRGSDGGLGSQAALALSESGRWLFAVNAGSDDVSVFAVARDGGLTLATRAATGGRTPVSVAVRGELVYVLDAGGDGDVSGFRFDGGTLTPIGRHALANRAPAPAEVAFTPTGDALVVTEKATSCIDVLPLDDDGRAGDAVCHPSAGQTPFGFAFAPPAYDWFGNRYDRLLVSEAFGGAPGAATLSTYLVDDGAVDVLAPAVRTEQTAACWVVLAHGGRYAYTTDTGSGAVTGFRVRADGALRLLSADGKSGDTGAGSKPSDAAVSDGFLDVLDSGAHAISTFRIRGDGSLALVGQTGGIPPAAAGLVGR